jgi:hypothetical protein
MKGEYVRGIAPGFARGGKGQVGQASSFRRGGNEIAAVVFILLKIRRTC